jgi:hypothetical protein
MTGMAVRGETFLLSLGPVDAVAGGASIRVGCGGYKPKT